MAARKRKSPDRRKPVRQPGLLSSLLSAAGRAAARHPRPVIGAAAFIVVFSFVAANALWYQPGGHPAPFLATRDASDPNAIAGYRPVRRAAPEEVTTFRIERADPDAPPSSLATTAPATESVAGPVSAPVSDPLPVAVPAPRPETIQREAREAAPQPVPQRPAPVETAKAAPAKPAQPASSSKAIPVSRPPEKVAAARNEDPVAAAIRSAERRPVMRPPAEIPSTGSTPRTNARPRATPVAQKPAASSSSADLVLQIQRGLSNIAYADVAVDGVAGEQTKAAIRRFQKHYRLPETGEPNEMVLKKLKSIGAL
ncbi:peptidoglycan-binding domain-containing protein [Neorhizobium petrolearium]|uniref:Peptidoglycan-binding protein n=1 Tax=Neorhizobium petrolearium TaxID=515361 RepID=A0ABY8M688_9HYPH|nr:peptidoglycan-binding domain-containing protein [Neorhizobium petrolearium]MCC2609008.1 peptidoglycan-binding protein [Neorhizobium petrolearium]WGI69249.1 peptidoglycan-binding protein [Neorhizobium petrolearium]